MKRPAFQSLSGVKADGSGGAEAEGECGHESHCGEDAEGGKEEMAGVEKVGVHVGARGPWTVSFHARFEMAWAPGRDKTGTEKTTAGPYGMTTKKTSG